MTDATGEGRLTDLLEELLANGAVQAVVKTDRGSVRLQGIASMARTQPGAAVPVAGAEEAGAVAFIRKDSDPQSPAASAVLWMRCADTQSGGDSASWLRCADTPDGSEVTAWLRCAGQGPDLADASWLRCMTVGPTSMWMRCAEFGNQAELLPAVSQLLTLATDSGNSAELSMMIDGRQVTVHAAVESP